MELAGGDFVTSGVDNMTCHSMRGWSLPMFERGYYAQNIFDSDDVITLRWRKHCNSCLLLFMLQQMVGTDEFSVLSKIFS